MRVTKRGLQLALGALWLIDAALQFQPYMFTRAFAREVIMPAADGQPAVVAAPVHFAAHLVAAHPVSINALFALVQLALAVGLFIPRTARLTLLASVGWSVSVWWLGEGLGGLASGHAMLLTGAPGAVVLYAFVALAALPAAGHDGRGEAPSAVAVACWMITWAAGGILQALPGQNSANDISTALRSNAAGTPGWIAGPTRYLAGTVEHHPASVLAFIVLPVLIAAAATRPGRIRTVSTAAGALLAVGFWIFGQGLGLVFSGQSTDPNSGPLLVLLAVATLTATRVKHGAVSNADRYCDTPMLMRPRHAAAT